MALSGFCDVSIFGQINWRLCRAQKWPIAAAIVVIVFVLGFLVGRSSDRLKRGHSQTAEKTESEDFAEYTQRIREQAILKVEPQVFLPVSARSASPVFPWKKNIVTTVFWVRDKSAWDENWAAAYGGIDDPDPSSRRDYLPSAFTPRQNPFYVALPYNDITHGQFKPEAPLVIPWFKQAYTEPGRSVCKDRWVAIRKGNRTCYAQWEDCGPFRDDYFQYVFQNERPKPNANRGAGLNVSPAVRDYLGLHLQDATDWRFVEVREVSSGQWRNYGNNNHFVRARRHATSGVRLSDEIGPDEPTEER